jgi:tRNA/tmRNA/rRNA uracil-C5-methylase (TrmA/RlmC/RlmD family)
MLTPDAEIVLTIDKAVPGGRMLGRHEGQVVLVAGAIPGERVRVRVDRVARQVAYGDTIEVIEPHADRRRTEVDWACGGSVYAHIRYPRQQALKSDIIADAFARIAKLPLAARVPVAPSEERGYRMRARLHARDGRIGFFREGTHELCDVRATGQLLPATVEIIDLIAERVLCEPFDGLVSIELVENVPADQRVLHFELRDGRQATRLEALAGVSGIAGLTYGTEEDRNSHAVWGPAWVTDVLPVSISDDAPPVDVRLQHHVRSFFQGNRWLLRSLVARVLRQVPEGDVIDLYAGVGLFGVALAALGRRSIVAVEGDRASVADLQANAAPYGDAISVRRLAVEAFLQRGEGAVGATIVLDPPRSGMSREAVAGLLARRAPRLVYVSCDLATLARDVRSFIDRGYRLEHLEAFDLFPNTAHVEAVVRLRRV